MIDLAGLAEAAVTAEVDDAARHAAVRCLVDWAGCALAGSAHSAVAAVARSLDVVGAGNGCTLAGRSGRASPFGAALVNGTASHVLDFDDVNVTMIGHPAVVVVPAALAVAEATGAGGEALCAGIAAGYEVAAELGAEVNPAHYEHGWHATATLGCAAAAAAACRVAGADPTTTARAISAATTQAGGVRAVFGSHGKSFHAGRAAATGVLASRLAEAGLDVPPDVWHGPAGYLGATGTPGGAPDRPPREAGPLRAVLDTAFKGHAACGATHCAIDAVAGIVAEHGLAADDVHRVEVDVHRLAVQAAGIERPSSGLEAKFSLRHTVAQAVLAYPLGPSYFTDAAADDPVLAALRERVQISVDESFVYDEAMPARVRLTTLGGATHLRYVDVPRGRPGNPMTDDELGAKFRSLAEAVLGAGPASELLGRLWEVRTASDVGGVARLLAR